MNEAIQVEGLCKSYGDHLAVDNFSFSVKHGTVFGLLGANGAGKSTTIECVLGTKKIDQGKITVLGLNPVEQRKKLFEKVGVQFQEVHYQDNIKVKELCEVTASFYRHPLSWKELLKKFGLAEKTDRLVKDLSGGERQRLFIVLALIPDPSLVFLDELTTGLDTRARRNVWKMLQQLKEDGLTILLTSHFMDEVEALCDEICILKKGKTVFYGTIQDATEQSGCKTFEDAYLKFTDEKEENDESL